MIFAAIKIDDIFLRGIFLQQSWQGFPLLNLFAVLLVLVLPFCFGVIYDLRKTHWTKNQSLIFRSLFEPPG